LQAFCAVARTGFRRIGAAKSLGISQPAVSKQIRLLETDLDLELLIRRSNRIVGLSSAGERFSPRRCARKWEAENLQRVKEGIH